MLGRSLGPREEFDCAWMLDAADFTCDSLANGSTAFLSTLSLTFLPCTNVTTLLSGMLLTSLSFSKHSSLTLPF